jgi:magnesium chelatase family protein
MRTVRVIGATLEGTGAEIVTVEARFEPAKKGGTEVQISGLPDPVIRESRGRLVCALEENGLRLGCGRLFLNLVPAGRKKAGEILDLPLALGAVAAAGHIDARCLRAKLFLGEVGIDGTLHAVPGGLAAALAAREQGVSTMIGPTRTAEEAACVPGMHAFGSPNLARVVAHLTHDEPVLTEAVAPPPRDVAHGPAGGLDEVQGQATAKHALAVAAAGGHGLLFVGPPGAGKSMLAQRLLRLLPPPNLEERLDITRVLSAAGMWPGGLADARPYRAPHHTSSHVGLVGGGQRVGPGEASLAHHGVLFLDELPEFKREALEALRQPLETGRVLIARANRRVELPARFQLIAAMNPCPCGYQGFGRIPCLCPPSFVQRYRQRISGPLLDRIDLRLELQPPTLEELAPPPPSSNGRGHPRPDPGPRESELIGAVQAATAQRDARGQKLRNVELDSAELERWAPLIDESRELLSRAADRMALSARAIQSLRRVARTMADMNGEQHVSAQDLARALALRASL